MVLYINTVIAMGLFNETDTDRPCLWCEHFGGFVANGSHALCVHEGGRQVQANPARGCVFWVRAIGSDDESESGKGKVPDSAD